MSSLIVIKINTPGGLVTTTKDIITEVSRSKRPFAVWITPEGASASSAGAIVASAAHFIFMSPGTNLGAATPVGLGEDIKENDGRSKAMNDLKALVRSLSFARGRPAAPFEEMIDKARSYTDQEALKAKIIDGVVNTQEELIKLLSSKEFKLEGTMRTLSLAPGLAATEHQPTLGQRILEVLANPSTAYILFLVGVALIYFEFQAPGGYVAGSVGVCLLILAAIAFQVLPLDWGSFGLIIIGICLLVLEVFITSYGLLSIAGVAAFVAGSLFLFHGDAGFISVKYSVIFSTLAGVVSAGLLIVWLLYKERKKVVTPSHFFLPQDATGQILTKSSNQVYQVKVKGEIWKAISEEDLAIGEQVSVVAVNAQELSIKIKKNF
ncbi:MAG TPA: NfeD family protein [Bacteriovoracaceae bacterium]|nr:NfeD family protein [Bacteriovoracaceae bacterium]